MSEPATKQEIVQHEAHPAPLTPMDMLDRAVSQGAGVEVLERLMGLHERYDATQARRAFDQALSEAKAEIGTIHKSKKMAHNDAPYETLEDIAKAVKEPLGRYGLSYRFETSATKDGITVTCIIAHRDGHSERNSLQSAPDASGGKNSIQAIGSAVTYLQRYSLKAALGLAASVDDDGKTADGPIRLNMNQAKFWLRMEEIIHEIRNLPTFKRINNMRDRLREFTFLPEGFSSECLKECDEREVELDQILAGKKKPEESRPDDRTDYAQVLYDSESQLSIVRTLAEIEEVKDAYGSALDGAPDEIWKKFNDMVSDAEARVPLTMGG